MADEEREMMSFRSARRWLLTTTCMRPMGSAIAALPFVLVASGHALAQGPVELGTVQSTAAGQTDYANTPDSAPYQAPSKAPLDATQPTSVISQHFIENNIPLTGNYDEIAQIAPSVWAVAPNGPGLAENQEFSIRGFQDGQFNVTFDGIPWGDSNDFTHHTTSYFMAHDLGEVSVDRGPGTAATIGNATFGGTISTVSKDPSSTFTLNPYVTFGSFNTRLYGLEVDTGTIAATGGTRAFFDGEGATSDGYLSNLGQTRKNFFGKVEQPLGDNTVLTVVGMYNDIQQYISLGSTAAQIAQFGPNYGLTRNPEKQNFYGYNEDLIHSDFEWIGTKSVFDDGWTLDDKIYSYAYYHRGTNGEDPNGEFPNGTVVGGVTLPNDVPGQLLQNDYRSYGVVANVMKDFGFLDIKTGIWFDHQINSRSLFEVDFSDNLAFNQNPDTGAASGVTDRELHQSLDTVQPYLQVDVKPLDGLTISPGIRYVNFNRSVDAQVNVKTGLAQNFSTDFDAILPSLLVHYAITPNWSIYAQAAEGFLAPNENFFTTNSPSTTKLNPQQSWNYQIGTAWQSKELTVSLDGYYIDFSNLIQNENVGGNTIYFNQGGVIYKGIEAEATYYVGEGFSVYANGSINSAHDKQTGQWIQDAPSATAAGGLIYDKDGVYASLIDKWIGSRYGASGQTAGLQPYQTLDLAVGYTTTETMFGWLPPSSIKVELNNITDETKIDQLAGATVQNGTNLYWTVPGRSVFMSYSIKFSPEAAEEATAPAAYVPPPAVAPMSVPKSYLVFFDFNKSDLTSQAIQIVDQAAKNAGPAKVTQLTVTGHTDTVGSDAYNMRLSRRRAESVAAELEKDGIASSEIQIVAKGKRDLLVPTADGVKEPQNRRVQIVYDGSGLSS
jgi:iron complex outermembrane receptor protein